MAHKEIADLRGTIVSAIKWRIGSQAFGQVFSWACTLMVIRLLEPADYGLMAMTQSFAGFLGILSGEGINTALIQKRDLSELEIRKTYGFLFIVNGVLCVFQLIVAPIVALYYQNDVLVNLLRVQAAVLLLVPTIFVYTALAKREIDFKRPAFASVLSGLASALVTLFAAWRGLGVWSLIVGQIVLFSTRAVVMIATSRKLLVPSFGLSGMGNIAKFGGTIMITAIVWYLYFQSDIFTAGRLLNAHDLGVYSTALLVSQMAMTKILPGLNDVSGSAFAHIQNDRKEVVRQFLRVVQLVSFVTMPIYAGLAVTAPTLVPVVLGEKWNDAIPVLVILSLAMPTLTISYLFPPVTNALGNANIALRANILSLVLMPPAFWIGINYFGLVGLGFAWLLIFPIPAYVGARGFCAVIQVKLRDVAIAALPGVICAAIMAAAVWYANSAVSIQPSWLRLCIQIAMGALIYTAVVILAFNRQFKNAFARRS